MRGGTFSSEQDEERARWRLGGKHGGKSSGVVLNGQCCKVVGAGVSILEVSGPSTGFDNDLKDRPTCNDGGGAWATVTIGTVDETGGWMNGFP